MTSHMWQFSWKKARERQEKRLNRLIKKYEKCGKGDNAADCKVQLTKLKKMILEDKNA